MRYSTEFSYIFNLLKSAARDIPEFYPDWVKKDPILKRYDLLSEIKKEIPVDDYREKIDKALIVEDSIEVDVKGNLRTYLGDIASDVRNLEKSLTSLAGFDKSDAEKHKMLLCLAELSDKLYHSLLNEELIHYFYLAIMQGESLSNALKFPSELRSEQFFVRNPKAIKEEDRLISRTAKIEPNIPIISAIKAFATEVKRLVKDPAFASRTIENLSSSKVSTAYDKLAFFSSKFLSWYSASEDLEIVFSKKPSDILSMSIREEWASCQDLLKEKDEYNFRAINSAVSPYCSIIYLTNGQVHKKIGEKMIARCLVLFLESDYEDPPILHVCKVYSNHPNKEKIRKLFIENLQKYSAIKVDGGKLAYNGEYSFPALDPLEGSSSFIGNRLPYFDPNPEGSKADKISSISPRFYSDTRFSEHAKKLNEYMLEFYESIADEDFSLSHSYCNATLNAIAKLNPMIPMTQVINGKSCSLGELVTKLKGLLYLGGDSAPSSPMERDRGMKLFYEEFQKWEPSRLPTQLSFNF